MSVFFSFGAVFASVLGYFILPQWSCPETMPCDLATQNIGWRIMLFSVAVVTFIMLLLRSFWIKLPETPKFLMSQDRTNETIVVLNNIAKINSSNIDISKHDLPQSPASASVREEYNEMEMTSSNEEDTPMLNNIEEQLEEKIKKWELLLSPRWRLTTFLVCCIWTVTALAYTMFNVFLPKYLETLGFEGESVPTRKEVYWDYMIYSFASVPGSVVSYIYHLIGTVCANYVFLDCFVSH
jgi:MFS family permease